MVGCNTNRTHSGGVKLRAGQFRGYRPQVKLGNTTEVNETIIFNKKSTGGCCTGNYANYSNSCAPAPCSGGGGGIMGILMAVTQAIPLLGMIFGGNKEKIPDEEGKGGPAQNVETPETTEPKKPDKPANEEDVKPPDTPDVYAATITPKTVKEQDATHTVKHGECWYDVLDAKYPGIPNTDRKAAMRALKAANGMTNPNSADMPRKMVLPKELKVGDNVYKLDNAGIVKGSVTMFTQGGMYNANITEHESTTYSVSGTKNGENAFSKTFTTRTDAEAAKKQWEAQNTTE